jgi:DNA-binding transcriptional ArsR family regulator
MAYPKNKLFAEEDQAVARISFALSHPARLFIASTLWREGPKYVFELEMAMPLSQGSVSHHLHKLQLEGLVKVEEHGLFNRYFLNIDRINESRAMFEDWYNRFRLPTGQRSKEPGPGEARLS